MKTIRYKMFNGDLNLFILPNGKVVHIPTEALKNIINPYIPDVACYIQEKQPDGRVLSKEGLARISDLKEYNIEDAISLYEYYGASATNFQIVTL